MKNDFALVDVWRNLHPALRESTWLNSSQFIGSRLDKFLISRDLLSPGIECHISPCLISDHDFVSLVFVTTTPPRSNTARVCGILTILFWKIRIFVHLLKNWLIVICVFYLLSRVFRIGGSFWNYPSKRNRSSSLVISGDVYVKNKCF